MAHRVFVVTDKDGRTTRIRASTFSRSNFGNGFWDIEFFDEKAQGKKPSAEMVVQIPFSVVPQDMLYDKFSDSLVYPSITETNEFDVFEDSLFSEAEKRPFTPNERKLVEALLAEAKSVIREKFDTSDQQQHDIDLKLDYLTKKVAALDKFNWKRLFISMLVGISVDLSFGTVVPSALLSVFTEILTHLIEKRKSLLPGKDEGKLGGGGDR